MARKTEAAAKTAPISERENPASPADAPELLDKLIAEGKLPSLNSTPSQKPPAAGFASNLTPSGPFSATSVALSDSNDGPKARLYRNQKFQQMAIQFDEKPDESIRQRLREDGWTWRTAEAVWTKQLGERPGETHRKAEEFFEKIVNDIRQARGLEPTSFQTHSR